MRRFLSSKAVRDVVFATICTSSLSSATVAPASTQKLPPTPEPNDGSAANEQTEKPTALQYLVMNINKAPVQHAAVASGTEKPNVTTSRAEEPAVFVNKFVALKEYESRVARRLRSRSSANVRRSSRSTVKHTGATPLQLHDILVRLSEIVENRQVSLVVSSRLVKKQWPTSFEDGNGRQLHNFISASLKAWLAEAAGQGSLTATEARAVLGNTAVFLRDDRENNVPIVAALAKMAVTDLDSVSQPDALISLMWAVHASGAHAPEEFWDTLVRRVLALNESLRGRMVGVKENAFTVDIDHDNDTENAQQRHLPTVGHVFSGLTTRQIYRVLEVLKREKWGRDVGSLRDLADQALKNVVFEAEATLAPASDDTDTKPLTKGDVNRRISKIADLTMQEFIDLLLISGDFGIPFSVSASRVSEDVLTPMLRFLNSTQLLEVMVLVRQTRCNSAAFMSTLADKIIERGPGAPYALPLSKGFVRTIVKETDLFSQVDLPRFLTFFLRICETQASKVRGEEVCSIAETLYKLSRKLAADSAVGLRIRSVIDVLCSQINRLLSLQLITAGRASDILEITIVMGMRSDTQLYPNVSALLETRNKAVERERDSLEKKNQRAENRAVAAIPNDGVIAAPRWENISEDDLPVLSKAALGVYGELIYMLERMAVVKASLASMDFKRFRVVLERTGLYNIFVGAHLVSLGHLVVSPGDSTAGVTSAQSVPVALPGWVEKEVYHIVVRKIRLANLSDATADDQILHVLGQVHCDEKKVHTVIKLISDSPLLMLRNQRDVWLYVALLARRFGRADHQQICDARLKAALF